MGRGDEALAALHADGLVAPQWDPAGSGPGGAEKPAPATVADYDERAMTRMGRERTRDASGL